MSHLDQNNISIFTLLPYGEVNEIHFAIAQKLTNEKSVAVTMQFPWD